VKSILKTHCPKGHPYDEANTYVDKGKRICRICKRESRKAYAVAHPDRIRAAQNKWVAANRERLNEYRRAWRAANRDHVNAVARASRAKRVATLKRDEQP
jgi:hypothetical protein